MINPIKTTLAAITLISMSAFAADMTTGVAPDNSKVNQRDRVENAKTADHQMKNSRSATEVTRMIRRELTKDDSLSVYAKNVKIITNDKSVMLRGPVNTLEEKMKVESIAQQVASTFVIQNEIEVKQQAQMKE